MINPDIEDKLDHMYGGVIAIGDYVWAPSMDGGLSNCDPHEDQSLGGNNFNLPNFDEGPNCCQSRQQDTSHTKWKCSNQFSYKDKLKR